LDDAKAAVEGANGDKMLDQTMTVDFAFVRPPPSGTGARRGAGDKGGRSGAKDEGKARARSRSPGARD
jgi:RNA-binding protein 8A